MAKIPSALDNMKPISFNQALPKVSKAKPKKKPKKAKLAPSKNIGPKLSVMMAMGKKGGKGGML